MIDSLLDYFKQSSAKQSSTQVEAMLHETHVSWVILAGGTAWKIKKPLQNPFLDYSTLDKRLAACLAELRLNRRYARDLYQSVVALRESSTGWQQIEISQDGVACDPLPAGTVEIAVTMKRFPEDALLATQLEKQQVSPRSIEQLAISVAQFHRQAEVASSRSKWGTVELIAEDQRDNFDYFSAAKNLSGSTLDTLAKIRHWSELTAEGLAVAFQVRKESGLVRACHGDLHLENIVHWQNQFIPFDGIEFSERLRWIDVMSDAAFVAMDLQAHHATSLANHFLNEYLEQTGDYEGLAVVRWYLVYRAMVRAKVAALRAVQAEGGTPRAKSSWNDVEHFIELANQLSKSPSPEIVITFGLSGSGKSRGSQQWVDQFGFVRARSDVERKRLFGQRGSELATPRAHFSCQVGDDIYSESATLQTYDRLLKIAELAVSHRWPIIIDATFLVRSDRQRFSELADRMQVPWRILSFHAPVEELEARIVQRRSEGRDASDADLHVLQQQIRQVEWLSDAERSHVVSWDPDSPPA